MARANPVILVLLSVIVLGLAAIVILTNVLSASMVTKEEYLPDRVMYFALHLGDPDNQPPPRQKRSAVENGSCSFEMNVNRTRESIILMENDSLRFRLILYENTANATPPMAAREAVEKLENVQPTKNPKKASQTSALRRFKQLTNGRKNDLFVLFVPCKVDVRTDLDDIEELVKEKEGLDGRTMIVSTTIPAQEISKLYAQPLPNVLGKENSEALARKIVYFASTATTNSTSSTPTTSPMNTTSSPPTTVRSNSTTAAPTTTTTVPTTNTTTALPTTTTTSPTTTARTTTTTAAPTTTTSVPTTSTTTILPTTTTTSPTTTVQTTTTTAAPPTTTTVPTTTTATTSPTTTTTSTTTVQTTTTTAAPTTTTTVPTTSTTATSPITTTTSTTTVQTTTTAAAPTTTTSVPTTSTTTTLPTTKTTSTTTVQTTTTAAAPTTTTTVPTTTTTTTSPSTTTTSPTTTVQTTNATAAPTTTTTVPTTTTTTTSPSTTTTSPTTTVQTTNTTAAPTTTTSVPTTSTTTTLPTTKTTSTTTVQTTTTTAAPTTTTTVPTTSTTTTLPTTTTTLPTSTTTVTIPTTTVIPKPSLSCLFVGDMYNFDANKTAYDQERSFIRSTSQSLFGQGNGFKAGLSLYGYADAGQRFPNAGLASMSSTFAKFDNDLTTRMNYDEDDDGNDKTTEFAIRAINDCKRMSEVNCLIFFSAQKDTAGLPELTPTLAKSAKIIAVGFNDTDLKGIVKMNGTAVSVPYAFSTEDVHKVVQAVLN